MRVIVYMRIAHVSATRAYTHVWECVQTCRLLLIGQRFVGVQIDRPHADDTRESRLRTTQGQVNTVGHITLSKSWAQILTCTIHRYEKSYT